MQDRPDKQTLLQALARFLRQEVHPQIGDKALGFRVLIAAHLAAVVAAECDAEEAEDLAQLGRLRSLMPELAPEEGPLASAAARRSAILRLQRELGRRLREGSATATGATLDHIRQTLREKLRVASPRFDTSAVIE